MQANTIISIPREPSDINSFRKGVPNRGINFKNAYRICKDREERPGIQFHMSDISVCVCVCVVCVCVCVGGVSLNLSEWYF